MRKDNIQSKPNVSNFLILVLIILFASFLISPYFINASTDEDAS